MTLAPVFQITVSKSAHDPHRGDTREAPHLSTSHAPSCFSPLPVHPTHTHTHTWLHRSTMDIPHSESSTHKHVCIACYTMQCETVSTLPHNPNPTNNKPHRTQATQREPDPPLIHLPNPFTRTHLLYCTGASRCSDDLRMVAR